MVHPSLDFLCILLNTTPCKKSLLLSIVMWSQSPTASPLFYHSPGQVRNKSYPLQEHFCKENENFVSKPHLKRLNKLWNLSPADAAASVFFLFVKIIFRDNPWFRETMVLNQVLKSGARPLKTPQPQPWDMSNRAVCSGNNWNLYQRDGDVIWDSSDITWKTKKNKRQHIHKHKHRHTD